MFSLEHSRAFERNQKLETHVSSATLHIIKVGSSSLLKEGEVFYPVFQQIANQCIALRQRGDQFVIVTSGAMAAVRSHSDHNRKRKDLALEGQQIIQDAWQRVFEDCIFLYARDDNLQELPTLVNRARDSGTVIVNGDDSDEESIHSIVRDNDELACFLATELKASHLTYLTDAPGVLDAVGQRFKSLSSLEALTLGKLLDGHGSSMGTGGIASKLACAARAASLGIQVVIDSSASESSVIDAANGNLSGTRIVDDLLTDESLEKRGTVTIENF